MWFSVRAARSADSGQRDGSESAMRIDAAVNADVVGAGANVDRSVRGGDGSGHTVVARPGARVSIGRAGSAPSSRPLDGPVVYVSSSVEDEDWRRRYASVLEPSLSLRGVRVWSEQREAPPADVGERASAVGRAVAGLVVVSESYLASGRGREELSVLDERVSSGRQRDAPPPHIPPCASHAGLGRALHRPGAALAQRPCSAAACRRAPLSQASGSS